MTQDEITNELEGKSLAELKAFADEKGISYAGNIGEGTLKARITNALYEPAKETDLTEAEMETPQDLMPPVLKDIEMPQTETQTVADPTKPTRAQIFAERKAKAEEMVRVRVTCMNPIKASLPGEFFSVGSNKLGNFMKMVPFNAPDGWHVPRILYNHIKNKKYAVRKTVKQPGQREYTTDVLVPEYAVEVLPPLTEKELAELKTLQNYNPDN